MTDLLILGCVSLTLLTAISVLFAYTVRQSVRDAARERDALDERHQAQIQSLLNRLMAIRWEDFITIETTETSDEGGFFTPGSEPEDDTVVGGQWGALSGVHQRAKELDENEQQLLREDFE